MANAWSAQLSPQMRDQLRDLHRIEPWKHGKILLLFAIWFACGAIAIHTPTLWVRIPCWIIIGFCLHGLGVFMHEGAHNCLFRKPFDRVIGFLCGLPVFFSCSNYRATHMLHHKYENSAQDPDNLEANFPFKPLRWLIYYSWLFVGMPMYILLVTVTGPFRAESAKERFYCVLETVLIAGFFTMVFTLASRHNAGSIVTNGWALALPFAVLVANIRGLAEHTLLRHEDPPNQIKSTRSLPSNRFISFFFNNQNYHLEHHLFPRVPWYNLPKVHQVLKPLYEKEEASVCPSYAQYMADALRYGPLKAVRYTPAGQSVPQLDA